MHIRVSPAATAHTADAGAYPGTRQYPSKCRTESRCPALNARSSSSCRPRCRVPRSINLQPPRLSQRRHMAAKLPIRVVAMRIKQRGRQFDLQRLRIVQQIDHRCGLNRRCPFINSAAACVQLPPRRRQILIRHSHTSPASEPSSLAEKLLRHPRRHNVPSTDPISSHSTCARRDAHSTPAPSLPRFSFSPSCRTSANGLVSNRDTCVSSVRAFTICPSEVFVASGSRYRATSKARAFNVRSYASGFISSGRGIAPLNASSIPAPTAS